MDTGEIWNPNGHFDNPLKNYSDGMSNAWTMNLIPDGATHKIATSDSLSAGTAKIVEEAFQNWLNHRFTNGVQFMPGQLTLGKIGLARELIGRFAKGAYGEVKAAEYLNAELTDWSEDKKDIDLKKDGVTYQVKTGESFSSEWKGTDADNLVWVELNQVESGLEVEKIHLNPKE